MRQVLRNATVVDGATAPHPADVALEDGRIVQVGAVSPEAGDRQLDCTGRIVMPGFIDAHSHADGRVFDDEVQLALLRQGITSIVGGQDGVSFAPGSGGYASEYFGPINGDHPQYRGDTVRELLDNYDGATRLNVAYLVPAGTVRWEVMGRSTDAADDSQLARMRRLVTDGMRDGAVGLSSGLDYVPGLFANARELAVLCGPVAEAGAVYVTHMRGGYEANSGEGIAEIESIVHETGVKAHISHFHAEPEIALSLLAGLESRSVDVTFDAYPYTRGCTLLAMPLLPPELAVKPVDEVVAVLRSREARAELRAEWFPVVETKASLGANWPAMITLAHVPAQEFAWAHGLTIAQAAARSGSDAIDFALDVLLATRLQANAVMAVPYDRPPAELGRILSHDRHLGGSDGVFVGAHPHPRARGSFARYLARYVRELAVYDWQSAAQHLSTHAAERFGLGQRGRLRQGWIADLVVVDPQRVADNATYTDPLALATGIDDVFVAGVPVLAAGALTTDLPGLGLRRSSRE